MVAVGHVVRLSSTDTEGAADGVTMVAPLLTQVGSGEIIGAGGERRVAEGAIGERRLRVLCPRT